MLLATGLALLSCLFALPNGHLRTRARYQAMELHPVGDRTKCVTAPVRSNLMAFGPPLTVEPCRGDDQQLWYTTWTNTKLASKWNRNMCIDLGSTDIHNSGTDPVLYEGIPTKMRYCSNMSPGDVSEPYGDIFESDEATEMYFRLRKTSVCLDLKEGNTNGGILQGWSCSGGPNQKWVLGDQGGCLS